MDDPSPFRRRTPPDTRPDIWTNGGQRPPFDLRAFGRASLSLTREGVAPLLTHVAGRTAGLAATVATGVYRVPEGRWRRTRRFLPSHGRVAGWIGGLAATLGEAGAAVGGAEASPSVRPAAAVAPVQPERPAAPPNIEPDPALSAIRAVLAEPSAPKSRVEQAPVETSPGGLTRFAGAALGWGVTVIALPYGALRAGLAHARGEDLRRTDGG